MHPPGRSPLPADARLHHDKCSTRPGYTNPCPVVFAPEPYCFCIDSPSYITCNLDSRGNVVGLVWGGGSWMQDSWDVRNRRDEIYYPPSDGDVLTPGTNRICRQPNAKDTNKITQVNITFPVDWPTEGDGPSDQWFNRIIGMFARVNIDTGDIAELTFVFDWEFQPGTTQPYYYASCGDNQDYTDSKWYFHKTQVSHGRDSPTCVPSLRAAPLTLALRKASGC
jgi:hypothetical protein